MDGWKSDGERGGWGWQCHVSVEVGVSLSYGLSLSCHPSTVLNPQGKLDGKNCLLIFLKQLLTLVIDHTHVSLLEVLF